MLQSRTTRTLTYLFVSMTVGALALMWMETGPILPVRMPLVAVGSGGGVIFGTDVPVQQIKWRNIVILTADRPDADIARSCHFVVVVDSTGRGGRVLATDLWKRQADGYHTFAPGHDWNSDSIGVCFVGKLTDSVLDGEQFRDFINLVRALQDGLRVPSERVYLCNDLDDRSPLPSEGFVRAFSRRLL